MKRAKKLAVILLAAAFSVLAVFFVGCESGAQVGCESGTQEEGSGEQKQRIDLASEDVSYSDYLVWSCSSSNFTWRKRASIPGMAPSYVGSAQLTIKVSSVNSAYQFENVKLEVTTSLGLGWDSEKVEIRLTDKGTGERTLMVEYDSMFSRPDAPDTDRCWVSRTEGFVLV